MNKSLYIILFIFFTLILSSNNTIYFVYNAQKGFHYTIKDFFQKQYPSEYKQLIKQLFLFKCSKGIYKDRKTIISDNIIHHNHLDMVYNENKNYQIWNKLTLDPYFSINYLLLPNEALIIDNHRILHGRQSFIGYRNIVGCYLNA